MIFVAFLLLEYVLTLYRENYLSSLMGLNGSRVGALTCTRLYVFLELVTRYLV